MTNPLLCSEMSPSKVAHSCAEFVIDQSYSSAFVNLVVYNHRLAIAIQTNNVFARIVEDLNVPIETFLQDSKR
jgi:hypothetical protein